jgi:hypothetical protein
MLNPTVSTWEWPTDKAEGTAILAGTIGEIATLLCSPLMLKTLDTEYARLGEIGRTSEEHLPKISIAYTQTAAWM